jgi:hypothetical protein
MRYISNEFPFTFWFRGVECTIDVEIEGADRHVGIMSDYLIVERIYSIDGKKTIYEEIGEDNCTVSDAALVEIENAYWDWCMAKSGEAFYYHSYDDGPGAF